MARLVSATLGLMTEGRSAFERGDFFVAHEKWEAVWLEAEGPMRLWLQGLIQVAAGLDQLARGRVAPAETLLARARAKLADAGPIEGIDVASVRALAEETLGRIERNR